MKTQVTSHHIRIAPTSSSAVEPSWNVFVGEENQAVFAGENGKDRALEYALRQAEALRSSGSVFLFVESHESGQTTRHFVHSKLAS